MFCLWALAGLNFSIINFNYFRSVYIFIRRDYISGVVNCLIASIRNRVVVADEYKELPVLGEKL